MRTILGRVLAVLNDWRAWALAIGVVVIAAVVDGQDRWVGPQGIGVLRVELALYWGSWLLWPATLVLAARAAARWRQRRPVRNGIAVLGLVLCLGMIWSRFIELYQLEVHRVALPVGCGVRVALVSDFHIGLFARTADLQRIVDKLNSLDVDAVLIAGDWTYQPHDDLAQVFAPIAALKLRPYAVLGNHDQSWGGDEDEGEGAQGIAEPLKAALGSLGVRMIEGQTVPLGRCRLTGVGDVLAGRAQRDLPPLLAEAAAHPSDVPRVMLAHEPNTVRMIPPGFARATLVGHTHGGQINIPWLTGRLLRRFLPGGWRAGLYPLPQSDLFVTTGTGTDHIPMRFNVPPSIDVIEL